MPDPTPARPDIVPIFNAADRAMQDELERWTIPVPEELRLALCRAVVKALQGASMLNYDRPWELDDRFADVLAEAGESPTRATGGEHNAGSPAEPVCTCPDIDVSTLNDRISGRKPTLKGWFPECPVHGDMA